MVVSLTAMTMATSATAGNAAPSLAGQHVLHVFPSFGVGGVPLRMVRIINHFGKHRQMVSSQFLMLMLL